MRRRRARKKSGLVHVLWPLVVHPSILEMLTHNRRMEPLAQPRLVARLDLMLCCGTVIVSVNLNAMRIMRAKRARLARGKIWNALKF